MTTQEKDSLALIVLSAAFCDGTKSEAERVQLRALWENLGITHAPLLVQRVLLKQVSVADAVAGLASPESRTLAYEMAVCVIEADGHRNADEARFLASLAERLSLPAAQTETSLRLTDAVTTAASLPPVQPAAATPMPVPPPTPAATPDPALDATIRNTAILAGALELLPQSAATLAVLPVQTHLVYRIGRHYGHSLDAGHIKEFLGVLGLGLASQAFEGIARKFLGGLVRRAGGGLAGSLASAATGPALTFATTYALGQLAQRYYAGGRTLGALQLKATFQELLGQAKTQSTSLLPEIQSRASSLNLAQLPGLIRGL
jgi:uncharacterized protein (DUF697 family)/uncharacterized tellurite resistance protein B-like protein